MLYVGPPLAEICLYSGKAKLKNNYMLIKMNLKFLYVLFLLAFSSVSMASTTQSKVYLARADQQIKSAMMLIQKAKLSSFDVKNPNPVFHYGWLQGDLADIRIGIQSYINDVSTLPSQVHALKKKYSY